MNQRIDFGNGYIRTSYISQDTNTAAIFNFETTKDIYFGETGDFGNFFIRGRGLRCSTTTIASIVGTASSIGSMRSNFGFITGFQSTDSSITNLVTTDSTLTNIRNTNLVNTNSTITNVVSSATTSGNLVSNKYVSGALTTHHLHIYLKQDYQM